MKYPKTIEIGPLTFTVTFRKKIKAKNGKELYGQILYASQEIMIEAGMTEDRTLVTFVHEVLHGISDVMDANLSEDQVLRVANGLVTFWKTNKDKLV